MAITISLFAAENTAIENRQNCLDAYGNTVVDEHPIKNICGCCGCICECACITVYGDDIGVTQEMVCLGGTTSWITSEGVEIGIVANPDTNACELELLSSGSYELGYGIWPDNVAIGVTGNRCPSPRAVFPSFTSDLKAIFFEFNCASCGQCPTIGTRCCGDVPRVLTATIDGGVDCACGSAVIPLIYDDQFDVWIGNQPTAFCGHGILLSLTCNSDGTWTLSFVAPPCIGDDDTQSGSCDPISIAFTINSAGGIGCCGVGDLGSAKTFTITVTE